MAEGSSCRPVSCYRIRSGGEGERNERLGLVQNGRRLGDSVYQGSTDIFPAVFDPEYPHGFLALINLVWTLDN